MFLLHPSFGFLFFITYSWIIYKLTASIPTAVTIQEAEILIFGNLMYIFTQGAPGKKFFLKAYLRGGLEAQVW